MEDKKLIEDLYSIVKTWFVSRIVLEPEGRILDAFLDHEESCTWRCPLCNKEYCIYDHVKESIWRDLDSGIYQTYLHARISRVECLEHGKVDHCGIALQRNDEVHSLYYGECAWR